MGMRSEFTFPSQDSRNYVEWHFRATLYAHWVPGAAPINWLLLLFHFRKCEKQHQTNWASQDPANFIKEQTSSERMEREKIVFKFKFIDAHTHHHNS